MKNDILLDAQEALGSGQLLKLTALVYLKEALVNQRYESCQELIETARDLGIDPGDINDVITDYLNAGNPVKQKANRLRLYKEV